MLTKLEVDDLQGHILGLPFRGNTTDYTVKSIDGLDPVKATIVTSSFAQLDGSQFQSAKRESRNIVVTIGIEPDYGQASVSELRAALYAYFMPKTNVRLGFYDEGTLKYVINGQVESCETALFSKDPVVVVSIMCFDPNFKSPIAVIANGNTVDTMTEMAINNSGTVETGYTFRLSVNRSIDELSLYVRRASGELAMLYLTKAFLDGDVVEISTEPADKHATLTRSGIESSVLYGVDSSSQWGYLWPGMNYIRAVVPGASMPYSLTYTPKFGGL